MPPNGLTFPHSTNDAAAVVLLKLLVENAVAGEHSRKFPRRVADDLADRGTVCRMDDVRDNLFPGIDAPATGWTVTAGRSAKESQGCL
jgi:hypothetical protein